MTITEIDSNCNIKLSKDMEISINKYIGKFDDWHPIINITRNELSLLYNTNQATNSFVVQKMRKYIVYDYTCFLNSKYSKELDNWLHMFFQQGLLLATGNKDSLNDCDVFKPYGKNTTENISKIIDNYTTEGSTEETSISIIVLAVKSLSLLIKHYLYALSTEAKKDGETIAKYRNNICKRIGLPLRIASMVDNEHIRDYWFGPLDFSMDNPYKVMTIWLPYFLRRFYKQLAKSGYKHNPRTLRLYNLIKPFVKTKHYSSYSIFSFDNDSFVTNILISLADINERRRGELYCLIQVYNFFASQLVPVDIKNMMYSFTRTTLSPPQSYCFTLSRSPLKVKEHIELSIEDLLDIRNGGETFKEIAKLLTDNYESYKYYLSASWEKLAERDAQLFFRTATHATEKWSQFYYDRIRERRTGSLNIPPSCFYLVIYNNLELDKKVEFSKGLVADLVDILISNKCDNQESLHEEMYIINYILKKAKIEDEINRFNEDDLIVNEVIKFMEPIISSEFINLNEISIIGLKELISNIIKHDVFYEKMKKITSVSQKLGVCFNVNLACNILGQLINTIMYTDDVNNKKIWVNFFEIRSASVISEKLVNEEKKEQRSSVRKQLSVMPQNKQFNDKMRNVIIEKAVLAYKIEKEKQKQKKLFQ